MKQECEIFIVDARDDESFSKQSFIYIFFNSSCYKLNTTTQFDH